MVSEMTKQAMKVLIDQTIISYNDWRACLYVADMIEDKNTQIQILANTYKSIYEQQHKDLWDMINNIDEEDGFK